MKRFKLVTIVTVFALLMSVFAAISYAATQEDFTLTILKDNNPVREFDGQVAIPFDTEYKLRLKNNNHRRCSATVWIDGAKVSEMGNFIIDGNDLLDLERFLNESLAEGKRFKFVPLNHPDVDDPNRAENGIIKVEFRLERAQVIVPIEPYYHFKDGKVIIDTSKLDSGVGTLTFGDATTGFYDSTTILCSTTSAGATVPGSHSNQSFYKVGFDGEDEVVTVQLKMVGI